jgi:uncharacterized membrane protein HdeD (DUF308 family)
MTKNGNFKLLKIALAIFALVVIVYGISQVFLTQGYMEMTGSEPVHPSWLRWPGGVLIALGIGAILVFRNPAGQDIFVLSIALGSLFAGLILMYTLLFEMVGQDNTWFTAMPSIINLCLSALLLWGRQRAKEIPTQG